MKFKTFPSVWAIHPDELAKVEHAYSDYMKKEIVVEAKEALFDIKETGKARNVQIIDNVGILKIEGIIVAKSDIFTEIFGGAPLDVLTEDFKSLVENDNINTIVLDIDSPGGTIDGVAVFAEMVFQGRKEKTILSHTSSIMTSAAIWIAAAAHKIFISDNTVTTGSIGVLTTHLNFEMFNEKIGIIPTEITAGSHKRITSQLKPLTSEGRAVLQGQVDHIMGVFVNDVARFRGVTTQNVTASMADGKIFLGSQAVEAGLVDGIISFDDLFEGEIEKIRKDIFLDHGVGYPGHEALIESLRADKDVDAGDAAIAILQAEKKKRAEAKELSNILDVPNEAVCSDLKERWKSDSSLRGEFRSYEIYEAYFTHHEQRQKEIS